MQIQNQKTFNEFKEFGDKIYIVAILSVLNFIIPFAGIIQLIYVFLALEHIKKIAYINKNKDLSDFRSKYIIGLILNIVALIVIFIPIISLFNFPYSYYNIYRFLISFFIALIIAVIFSLVGGILQWQAWGCLEYFFETNREIFPPMVLEDTLSGIRNLKLGAIFSMTVILSIIGIIFEIIGYFQLASLKKILYDFKNTPHAPTSNWHQPPPVPSPQFTFKTPQINMIIKFCPHCGIKIQIPGKFCSKCGARII